MRKASFLPRFGHFLGFSAIAALLVGHFFESQKAARAEAVLAEFSSTAAQAEHFLSFAKQDLLDFVEDQSETYETDFNTKSFKESVEIGAQTDSLGQFLKKPIAGELVSKLAFFEDTIWSLTQDRRREFVKLSIDPKEAADFLNCSKIDQIEPFLTVLRLQKDFLAIEGLNVQRQKVSAPYCGGDKYVPVFIAKQLGEIPIGQKVEAAVFLSAYSSTARKPRFWANGKELFSEGGKARFEQTFDREGRYPLKIEAEYLTWNDRKIAFETRRTAADYEIFVGPF